MDNNENSIKKIMKEKLGEFISLEIDRIQISEFNTRSQFVDDGHVENLMVSIDKNGYIPKSAVWLNAVTGVDGKIINYRLVAGRHRYEACKRLGLKEIPCQLYYNLMDEEEAVLDTIDNELDEHHKPVNVLAIAEHYKYLRDVKGWSVRKIALTKNVSKPVVQYRLKISELSVEIMAFLRGVRICVHPPESYFREICKLTSIPYQKMVLEEIISKNSDPNKKVFGSKRFQNFSSYSERISYEDVKARVEEFLELERLEKGEEELLSLVENSSQTGSSVSQENGNKKIDSQNLFSIVSGQSAGKKDLSSFPLIGNNLNNSSHNQKGNSVASSSSGRSKKNRDIPGQAIFEIFSEIAASRVTITKPKEFRFSVLPMWIRHTDLIKNLSCSAYHLLLELISYDFRYKPDKDKFFFIKYGKNYENCMDFLAHLAGVTQVTLEKKVLPALVEFVYYKKNGGDMRFQLRWNNLFEVYKERAPLIPFDDGGLQDIPIDYTGWIRPTPYHSIYIERGIVKPYKEASSGIKQEVLKEETTSRKELSETPVQSPVNRDEVKEVFEVDHREVNSPVADKLNNFRMAQEQINFCMENKELTEDVLKYFNEQPQPERDKIKNPAGFIYKLVKDGFKAPEGFKSCKEVKEMAEKKKAVEEFGDIITELLNKGEIKYFCPGEGKKYPISCIPNNNTFLYTSRKGLPVAGNFREWMNKKYFSG